MRVEVSEEAAREVISSGDLNQRDLMLICLAYYGGQARPSELKQAAGLLGYRSYKKLNPSLVLGRMSGFVSRRVDGSSTWVLLSAGEERLVMMGFAAALERRRLPELELRSLVGKIQDEDRKRFVSEALLAHEFQLHRSSIVMTWVGALSILQDALISSRPAETLEAFKKRRTKVKEIDKTHFESMRDIDVIELARATDVLTKNEFSLLRFCLDSRNVSGHPNSFHATANEAALQLERLINIIYANPKFAE